MNSTTELAEKRSDALEYLRGNNDPKAKAIRAQIEAINPEAATRRELDRLAALCRKVEKFISGELGKKRFGRQPSYGRPHSQRAPRGQYG